MSCGGGPEAGLRLFFRTAAVYNLAFFFWAAVFPGHYFALAGFTGAERFHHLWQCVGMVVGVYGIAYWHLSNHLRSAPVLATIGLLGKTLGPAGWVFHMANGGLSAATFPVILLNDLIWWPGFARYFIWLRAPRISWYRFLLLALLATHAAGGLLAWWTLPAGFYGGLEGEARLEAFSRMRAAWVLAWAAWCVGDIVSLPFTLELLRRHRPALRAAFAGGWGAGLALAIIVIAAGCDLALNGFYASWYAARFDPGWAERDALFRFLSLAVANGLFILGYGFIAWGLWRGAAVPGWISALGLPAWAGSLGLCLHGLGLYPEGMPLSGALFTLFFCAWLLALWYDDRRRRGDGSGSHA